MTPKNGDGKTPPMLAKELQHKEIEILLNGRLQQADVTKQNNTENNLNSIEKNRYGFFHYQPLERKNETVTDNARPVVGLKGQNI